MVIKNDKILYLKVFNNPKVHVANQAYWAKVVKKCAPVKYKNDWNKFFHTRRENFNDVDAPIYLYYNQELNKCVRIIQYDPVAYNVEYRYSQWLTAWISDIFIEDKKVPELVICILLTRSNCLLVKQLIKSWLSDSKEVVCEKIQQIYNGQK